MISSNQLTNNVHLHLISMLKCGRHPEEGAAGRSWNWIKDGAVFHYRKKKRPRHETEAQTVSGVRFKDYAVLFCYKTKLGF